MAPSKTTTAWDDEESDSTPPSSPPVAAVARRGKFDDEEDSDVLESWDAAEDSEEEREKAKKAAEAKAKADAEAKANHKSKAQRIEEKRQERMRQLALEDDEDSDEDEADRRARAAAAEKESDLKNAEDLFGGVGGVPASRGAAKAVTVLEGDDPSNAVDLSSMKLFNPSTLTQFKQLRENLVPLLNQNGKKPHYEIFMKEFTKEIVRDLNSEQVKKLASTLTAVSNEKLKEEKAADKGGKKSKAAKTKTTLNASRNIARDVDTAAYDDDGLDDGDFM